MLPVSVATRSLSKTPTLACAVGAAGLEIGILAGLIASTFYFAFTYARVGSRASMLCTVMVSCPSTTRGECVQTGLTTGKCIVVHHFAEPQRRHEDTGPAHRAGCKC